MLGHIEGKRGTRVVERCALLAFVVESPGCCNLIECDEHLVHTVLLSNMPILNRLQQADSVRRHSSPVLAIKSDRSNEIARLIGLIAESNLHGGSGDHGSAALVELKTYVQKWPEAQATLEEQVDRLKPRFRSFILEGCKAQPGEIAVRSTPLRGRMKARANENVLRPAGGAEASDVDQGTAAPARSNNRLQEIRRRMGTLGGTTREPTEKGEDLSAQLDRWASIRPHFLSRLPMICAGAFSVRE